MDQSWENLNRCRQRDRLLRASYLDQLRSICPPAPPLVRETDPSTKWDNLLRLQQIFAEHDIDYWLTEFSLLQLVHQQVLASDQNPVQLAVDLDSMSRLSNLVNVLSRSGFTFSSYQTDRFTIARERVEFELCIFSRRNLCRAAIYYEQLEVLELLGSKIPVPGNAKLCLTEMYGPWRDEAARPAAMPEEPELPCRVYVNLAADLFHAGHVRFLRQARAFGTQLIAGIHSDQDIASYKRRPYIAERYRQEIVASCRYVDEIIEQAPLKPNRTFFEQHDIDVMVHGDDMHPDCVDQHHIAIEMGILRYVPYTSGISTTQLAQQIQSE